jgi:chorismate lyase / 3-hydroxybenzoate synthase
MTSLPPARLQVTRIDPGNALARFDFAPGDPSPMCIPCPPLPGSAAQESWFAGEVIESADTRGAAWAHAMHYALVAISVDEIDGNIEQAAQTAYERLITCVRPSAHPYLLRIWNYFGHINDGDGDGERYRRFCVGRARGVDGMFNDPPPAATAIGSHDPHSPPHLQVIALCARRPAVALENPRQTPAWRYPREFGPVSPGFSRGALVDTDTDRPRLLASGTASIVGHVSQHVGDVAAQLRESLANLGSLLAEGEKKCGRVFPLENCEILRVYLRKDTDLVRIQAIVAESGLPTDRVIYLRGDVCRRELDVEIEGVFAAQ